MKRLSLFSVSLLVLISFLIAGCGELEFGVETRLTSGQPGVETVVVTVTQQIADNMVLVTVTPSTDVNECCETMERHQIRRVPVIDADGNCCGMVSQADIARQAPARKTAEVVREVSQPAAGA